MTTKNSGKRTSAAPAVASKGAPLSHGVGRRKSSVARVWLRRGSGKMMVNGRDYSSYFDTDAARIAARRPLVVLSVDSYDVEVNVVGGGLQGQAGAISVGLARALLLANPEYKQNLRGNGLLTVDSRLKERKKYGQKAARRGFQFVKR